MVREVLGRYGKSGEVWGGTGNYGEDGVRRGWITGSSSSRVIKEPLTAATGSCGRAVVVVVVVVTTRGGGGTMCSTKLGTLTIAQRWMVKACKGYEGDQKMKKREKTVPLNTNSPFGYRPNSRRKPGVASLVSFTVCYNSKHALGGVLTRLTQDPGGYRCQEQKRANTLCIQRLTEILGIDWHGYFRRFTR